MKQIKKYLDSGKAEGLASKLASYSAMAAAAIAFTPDMSAQTCVAAGGTLPVDIDGDGTPDITISNTTSTFLSTSGTATAYYAVGPYILGPGFNTIVTGPTFTPAACGLPVYATAGPLGTGDGLWTLQLYTYYINFQYIYNVQAAFTYVNYNLNYVTAGANQIVGLSAGSSVCAGISSAGATAPATAPVLAGLCYNGSYGSVVNVFTSYLFYNVNILTAIDAEPVSNPNGCTVGGLPQAYQTLYIPPYTTGPYGLNTAGTAIAINQIAGPSSNVLPIGPACATIPALGVEFTSATDGGTHYGWIQLSIGADGLLCVDATGWNGCSVEEVAAAGAAAGTECIAVGDATLNEGNEACTPAVCTLTSLGLAAGACVDPGTPDTADDTFTLTIDPTGTELGTTYTISGGAAGTGTYGTPFTVTLPADGAAISITVTDDTDATCTLTEMVTAPMACSTPLACSLTSLGLAAGACVDPGTPDTADDTFTLTIDPTGTDLGTTYTISGGASGTGTYGTPFTVTLPADGAAVSITVTDDTDATCTLTEMVTAPTSCSVAAPVCEISTIVDTMCEDGGTPEDPSDDVTTITVTVNNSDTANFPTFSDDQGNAGVAYGTPIVYTVTGDGGLTVNFTDDTDAACTDSITVTTGCATVENIPTVGEWGLIMLGLLMSITAVVGIRQRREEEVTA